MKFRVVVVGRPRGEGLQSLIAEYESRAVRYWPLDVVEVRAEQGSEAQSVQRGEAVRILARVGNSRLIVCDEGGKARDSHQFSAWLQGLREAAQDVTFVIGGAFGVDETVRRAASERISLAPFTLPHELARLVLAEQIYRAGTIVRREPYHKD